MVAGLRLAELRELSAPLEDEERLGGGAASVALVADDAVTRVAGVGAEWRSVARVPLARRPLGRLELDLRGGSFALDLRGCSTRWTL